MSVSPWQMYGPQPSPDDPLNVKLVHACVNPVCEERLVAIVCGRFFPSKSHKAWVWLDQPLRRMAPAAWQDVWERDVESRDGQRYRYPGGSACPFCGGELPEPRWDDLDDCEGA